QVLGLDPADVAVDQEFVGLLRIVLPEVVPAVADDAAGLHQRRIAVAHRARRRVVRALVLLVLLGVIEPGQDGQQRQRENSARLGTPLDQSFSFHFFAVSIASKTGSCSCAGAPSTMPRQALIAATQSWLSVSSRKGRTAPSDDLSP